MIASTKARYKRLFEVTREEINLWDPMGLIDGGSPLDEYDLEVTGLIPRIVSHPSEKGVRDAVAAVFAEMFGQQQLTSSASTDFAARLHSRLLAGGLL